MTAKKHHVFLVPGFFGFANLGELMYFGHVRDYLEAELRRRGVDAQVHTVLSHPTASIRTRAADLLAALKELGGEAGAPPEGSVLHLVGHSTGGLDARLLVTPGARLGEGLEPEPYAARVKSVVCVATPQVGTPLASFFLGFFGHRLLELLSLFTVYALRFGRLPLSVAFRFGGLLAKADDQLGWRQTLLDQLFGQLLSDFSKDRREALVKFFREVGSDTSLIPQLTPQNMDLFNAATPDRPGVRYGSVVTRARPPSLRGRLSAGLDPYAQLTHSIYSLFHGRAGKLRELDFPRLQPEQSAVLLKAYGKLPQPQDSDGIVPTRSQPYGKVIAAVNADHLDVIGHFDEPSYSPPHVDWLISGSGFRRFAFERTWRAVVDFMLEETPERPPVVSRL
jgi:triacylglycerol lipase